MIQLLLLLFLLQLLLRGAASKSNRLLLKLSQLLILAIETSVVSLMSLEKSTEELCLMLLFGSFVLFQLIFVQQYFWWGLLFARLSVLLLLMPKLTAKGLQLLSRLNHSLTNEHHFGFAIIVSVSCLMTLFLFKNKRWMKSIPRRHGAIFRVHHTKGIFSSPLLILVVLAPASILVYCVIEYFLKHSGVAFVLALAHSAFLLWLFRRATRCFELRESYKNSVNYTEGILAYSQNLEKNLFNLQSFRHDYLNIVTTMELAIQEQNLPEITKVFYSVVQPSKEHLIQQRDILLNLHGLCPELKSLFTHKIKLMQSKNIALDLVVTSDLAHTGIAPLDLTRILSILLDNAIEETEIASNPTILIRLLATPTGDSIILENSLHRELADTKQLATRYLSTKKGHSGIGLSILSELLATYPHVVLRTKVTPNQFIQTLAITNLGV